MRGEKGRRSEGEGERERKEGDTICNITNARSP
jgi:hypothetical protein